MARSPKKDADPAPEPPRPSFEDSLGELQQIVRQLEDGSLGLEESLARFEQGVTLLRNCYQALERAEQRIEILTGFDSSGNPLTSPFDATATAEKTGKQAGRRSSPPAAISSPPAPAESASPPLSPEAESQTTEASPADCSADSGATEAADPRKRLF